MDGDYSTPVVVRRRRGKGIIAPMAAWRRWLTLSTWWVLTAGLLAGAARPWRGPAEQLHRFTARLEFDFAGWTLDALGVKLGEASVAQHAYLGEAQRVDLVRRYLRLLDRARSLEGEIERIYADPDEPEPEASAAETQAALEAVRRELAVFQPPVEAVLQEQAGVVLAEAGVAALGAPFPPVAFHLSRLPMGLVVSPRTTIRQDALLQLVPDLTLEQQVSLEAEVERDLGVSALVVPIGGVGTYPTMVQETTSLDWMAEVVLHEWVHNYLTLRPLGLAYDASPETRTMNETAASLLGKAFGRRLLELYYPDLVPPPADESASESSAPPPAFDFNAEMHATRVEVDRLLAEGLVEEAEAYMEDRRRVFVEHGYWIRRLNQAYFAFHGAYADAPESAAGEDPVGQAVRELWERSASPAAFLRAMAAMNSYEDLLRELGR